MLEQGNLDIIKERLTVPSVIEDLLEATGYMPSDMKYALHEVINDFQPDAALLCIALSIKALLEYQPYKSNSLKIMAMECDRLIADYAPLWLEHLNEENIDPTLLFDTLSALPEDLENISDLILLNVDFIRDTDPKAAEILDILEIQASAQAIIAEQYVDVMEESEGEEEDDILPFAAAPAQSPVAYNDNVIPFPGSGVRS